MDTKKFCDLHTHSNYSDGSDSPAELVAKAKKAGLSAIALSDHNTLDGLEEFLQAGKDTGLETVAGVEISADYKGKEVHVLGLFINKENFTTIREFIRPYKESKESSNRLLFENLVSAGYKISYERIWAEGDDASINRVHFAKELMRCGYINSLDEGFDTVLSPKMGYYLPSKRINSLELISFLRSLSVVSVLAHPFLKLTEEELHSFIADTKPLGLSGIETNYSTYTEEQTEKSISIAAAAGLLKSGGSDYHGENKPQIALGVGQGNLFVPYSYYQSLKEYSLNLKA